MAGFVEWAHTSPRDFFGDPIIGGRERGQEKSPEKHLLKKWRECDTKPEEKPRCSGRVKDLLNRRVGGTWHEHAVEPRQQKANERCSDQSRTQAKRGRAVPLQSR